VVALDEALEALDLRDEWLVVSLHKSERFFHGAWILPKRILLRAAPRFSSRTKALAGGWVGAFLFPWVFRGHGARARPGYNTPQRK
jgi:hypothetical protein